MTKQVDPQVRASLVRRLRERRATEELRAVDVRRAAAGLGVTERTVWRWLASDQTASSSATGAVRGYRLSERDRADYLDWRGNIAGLRRARLARGEAVPSVRTLQRAFAGQMSPGERAAVVDGVEGRRRHQVYLRWESAGRNERWEADHKELPVLVRAPRGMRAVKPWVTVFLDCYSRLIMGWAVSLRPSSASVLAALRQGLVVDPERGPFGGVPAVVVPDNGLEFAAAALGRACAALGIELAPTDAYAPHQKGKLERVNRTMDQELISGLPFFTGCPRAVDGRLYGPDVEPMALELFVARFAEWVAHYNTERVHGAVGETPLARWRADATPVREVAAEQLRWMLLADVERTVNKDGVHFSGLRFVAGALNGLVGEKVQIRYMPHDLRQIEVFRGDEWLTTAYPQGTLSPEQREEVLARRRADAAELGRRQRRASRRARATLAPMTGPGAAVETTTISAEQARRHPGEDRDAGLRRLARTNLLDLKTDFAFWNPDFPDPRDLDGPARPAGAAGTEPGDDADGRSD